MRSLNPFGRRARDPQTTRRDPAPSRVSYRLHRLWLTPFFRVAFRVGLPGFALAFGGGLYLSSPDRRADIGSIYVDLREHVKNRPEFLVTLLSVDGASPELAQVVRETLSLPLPQSSLDIDLEAARASLAALDPISDVQMRVQPVGILQVLVTEREPAIVWRMPQGVFLLDEEGTRVAQIESRLLREDLPLIAGEGAEKAVPEALAILASAGPILPRVRGLVRMGARRWDIVLDREQRILLPVDQPIRALERLLALDQAAELLERDVLAVDLRLQDRPTLRLAPFALAELRRMRGIISVESDL
ncbi:MAG: cell division protein FtsQ/DivIB [Pseudorhodobacter sp.]|nr:cell division protein FtsQ/DivIB [Pseudorhodobacter sp.]